MADVRMGVLGLRQHCPGSAHLPAISRNDQAKLAAVCDTSAERAEESAAKWGAESGFTDYREMYEKANLDAVVIATPNYAHRDQAIAAAQARDQRGRRETPGRDKRRGLGYRQRVQTRPG